MILGVNSTWYRLDILGWYLPNLKSINSKYLYKVQELRYKVGLINLSKKKGIVFNTPNNTLT